MTTFEGYGGTKDIFTCTKQSRPMGSRWVSVGNTLREGIGDTGNFQPAVRQGAALAIYVGFADGYRPVRGSIVRIRSRFYRRMRTHPGVF